MARKILLADDSVTAQNMGRKILTDAGYEVVTVNNGSAALKKIAECKPSVVVLDVYMPGYSGLEVCARIKEGRDTAAIPVLLTVGKLEPFRQEEARKVRADAFIIKPFEATELLAALSKLESKIGSQPAESAKTRSAATTMERYEREAADAAPQFGDQESGWKARLTMPSPAMRREEPVEDPDATTISMRAWQFVREVTDPPEFSVSSVPFALDSSSPLQGLPADATPDELAAIAAAAAAVGKADVERDFERLKSEPPPSPQTDEESSAPVSLATQPQPAEAASAPMPSSGGPVSAQVEAVFTSFAASAPVDSAVATSNTAPAPKPAAAAVIAGSDSASMAVGSRWVAEEVPVEAAESALVLEREMHKAFAAFAAAEHGASYEPAPVDKNDEPIFASIAPPAIGAPTPFSSAAETESGRNLAAAVTPLAETAISSSSQGTGFSDFARPPVAPFAPAAAEEAKHAVVAFGEPHPFREVESTPAAASATEGEGSLEPAAAAGVTPADTLPDGWHDLRQTDKSPAVASANETGNGFEEFRAAERGPKSAGKEIAPEAAMAAAASGDASTSSPADASLSSIVDNMLAELKPKLMAELAKKLEKK